MNPLVALDLIQTLALAGIVLFVGYGIKRLVPPLSRYNIPAPVVGGLLVSVVVLLLRRYDPNLLKFDTTLQVAAPDRVLHHHRIRRQPLAAARRRPDGGASSSSPRRSMAIAQNVLGVAPRDAARAASADRRACRLGDADRWSGHRAGVCAVVRAGRRAERGHRRGRGGDGRHRVRRPDWRPDRDVADSARPVAHAATRARSAISPRRRRRSWRIVCPGRSRRRRHAKTSRRMAC